jgi:DNA-binding transcriptional regulator YiaG
MDAENLDIRTLREKLNWSRSRLADYLGVNVSTVTRLENGLHKISGPIRRLLKNLAESDDPDALLSESETPNEATS